MVPGKAHHLGVGSGTQVGGDEALGGQDRGHPVRAHHAQRSIVLIGIGFALALPRTQGEAVDLGARQVDLDRRTVPAHVADPQLGGERHTAVGGVVVPGEAVLGEELVARITHHLGIGGRGGKGQDEALRDQDGGHAIGGDHAQRTIVYIVGFADTLPGIQIEGIDRGGGAAGVDLDLGTAGGAHVADP